MLLRCRRRFITESYPHVDCYDYIRGRFEHLLLWTSPEDIHSFHIATLDSHENDFGHTLPFDWEKWTIFDKQFWAIWTGHRLRYIEDPFDLKHNLAGRCSAAGWAKPCQRLMLM